MFRNLELNPRMQQESREAERRLFKYVRQELACHTVGSPEQFHRVVRALTARVDALNAQRIGRGHYMHVDAAMPTDRSDGWVKLTYLDVRKAQARITLTHCRGAVDGDSL